MSTATKQQVSNFLTSVKNQPFHVHRICAYVLHGKIHFFAGYTGQGIDANVYNRTYEEITDFTDTYNEWLNGEFSKKNVIDIIQDAINI